MIEKEARGGSRLKDPVQKEIVSEKDDINERTSRLIDFIKELKKGWNGNQAPGVGVDEKYKLVEPMPDQLLNSGQMALQEFSKILEALKEINQKQDNYAVERQQRLEQRMQQPVQASVTDYLIKEASNPLSRLWSHIKAPFSFVEKNRWERLRLLRALAKISKDLEDLNDKVLAGDKSIEEAVYKAKQLYSESKSAFFEDFEKNLKQSIENIENETEKKFPETFDGQVVPGTPKEEKPTSPVVKPKKEKRPKVQFQFAPTVNVEPIIPTIEEVEQVLTTPEQATPTIVSDPLVVLDKPSTPAELIKTPNSEKETQESEPNLEISSTVPEVSSTIVTDEHATPIGTTEEFIEDKVPESIPIPLVKIKETPKKEPPVTKIEEPKLSTKEQSNLFKSFISSSIKEILSYVNKANLTIGVESGEPRTIMDSLLGSIENKYKELKTAKRIGYQYKVFVSFIEDCGKSMAFAKQIALYNNVSEINQEEFSKDVQDVIGKYVTPATAAYEKLTSINKIAADPLTMGVRRLLTNILPSRDKNIRLKIDSEIKNAQNALQKMMDVLEQRDLNYSTLISYSEDFYNSFTEVFDKLADLADNYNAQLKIDKSKGKKVSNIISQVEISYLRRIKAILQGYKDNIGTLKDLEGKLADKYLEISKKKEQ
jgi:hypothetical protein